MALTGIFDSQIAGGKRYDLATLGRRRANATYAESHGVDTAEQVILAMDLGPLMDDDELPLSAYVGRLIRDFGSDVNGKLARQCGATARSGARGPGLPVGAEP
jgi:hypothetical protein